MRLLLFLSCAYHLCVSGSFVQPLNANAHYRCSSGGVSMTQCSDENPRDVPSDRRKVILAGGSWFTAISMITTKPALAVERAVGAAEKKCREEGNCLELGDLDGAVGWNWGAKERCDATDPKCGVNGVLVDELAGAAVPEATAKITHRVQLSIAIGRTEEGILNLGLYGEVTPLSVSQLLQFLSPEGLWTLKNEDLSQAVALGYGLGSVTEIMPQQQISFGLPSQATAYAKTHGVSSAGSDFVAQPRPPSAESEKTARQHDQAGLVSIATKGVGYANTFCDNDEAFANAFSITAAAVPALDKSRKVIGQVLDPESMAFLARLSQLPTNKGLKGIVPGQNSGPPLLKTSVKKVTLEKVVENE